jgi:hypothetical protein
MLSNTDFVEVARHNYPDAADLPKPLVELQRYQQPLIREVRQQYDREHNPFSKL